MNRHIRRWKCAALILGMTHLAISAQRDSGFFSLEPTVQSNTSFRSDPFNPAQPLETRVRAYLDANCAYCHQPGIPGRGGMDLRFSTPLENTGLFAPSGRPAPDGGALQHIQPGFPEASDIYLRMASLGSDGMPPVGKTEVDERGLSLMREWIESLARDSVAATGPMPDKASLRIHYRDRLLEVTSSGLKLKGNPIFRIYPMTGDKVEGLSLSVAANPDREGWVLRLSQPLPRGRYRLDLRWDDGRIIREFLVL